MTEIVRRFRIHTLAECRGCGGIVIATYLEGGTSDDPIEVESEVQVPDPNAVIQPPEGIPPLFAEMFKSMGTNVRNIRTTPGGALIELESVGPRRRRDEHDLDRWNFELTREDYDLIGPLKIGDIIVQKVGVEVEA